MASRQSSFRAAEQSAAQLQAQRTCMALGEALHRELQAQCKGELRKVRATAKALEARCAEEARRRSASERALREGLGAATRWGRLGAGGDCLVLFEIAGLRRAEWRHEEPPQERFHSGLP